MMHHGLPPSILVVDNSRPDHPCERTPAGPLLRLLEALGARCTAVKCKDDLRRELASERFHGCVLTGTTVGGPSEEEIDTYSTNVSAGVTALDPAAPVLGICWGFQILAEVHAGKVGRLPEPHRGGFSTRLAPAVAEGLGGIMRDLPPVFVGAYDHQSHVEATPPGWQVLATTQGEGGSSEIVAAMRHPHRPLYGILFHPEGVAGDAAAGEGLLRAFVEDCAASVTPPPAPRCSCEPARPARCSG